MEERKILVARTAGFCFGVKRAVEKVYETVTLVETSVTVFLLYMDHKKLRWNPL